MNPPEPRSPSPEHAAETPGVARSADGPEGGISRDSDDEPGGHPVPAPASGDDRRLWGGEERPCGDDDGDRRRRPRRVADRRAAERDRQERLLEEDALVRALFSQSRVGLAVHDALLRVTRTNLGHDCFRPLAVGRGDPDGSGRVARPVPRHPESFLEAEDAARLVATLSRVAETGEPVMGVPHRARCLGRPDDDRVVSLSALPLLDADGAGRGVLTSVIDITDEHRDRERLAMVSEAAKRIGTSLDLTRCAEELADFLVPEFADLAAVDFTEVVLVGEEPGDIARGAPFTRVGVAAAEGEWPAELYQPGETALTRTLETEYLREPAVQVPDLDEMRDAWSDDDHRRRLFLAEGAVSYMWVPLHARGLVLGSAHLWRRKGSAPFDRRDADLAEEVVSRAALAVDNARRYTQERRTAEALRRSLLPPSLVEVSAAEAAGSCLPAATTAGVGGTWFDVIPLSSARVAFVVGDSVGHGLEATAATGRLRTAVQTLSDLDLPPDELLAHLDDLVERLSADDATTCGPAGRIRGSTCLYAVYDPVTGHCTMASAGHPPPAVISPDGDCALATCEPGPPLGEAGEPLEPFELALEPGSRLAFYSGNLPPAREDHSPASRLCDALGEAARTHSSPADVVRETLSSLVPKAPDADTTLLLAWPRRLPADHTAEWRFPADPAIVGQAREVVAAQLASWGLDDLVFTTELIASELVTNAIRYAGGPVTLRLIKDETLICEVSDPTQTHPHLRRARPTDEGGRGLFLIHQLTERWGSRYTPCGKTIWTGQRLPDGTEEP
ncbi:protein phosphatase [Streptomyces sp. RKND-216]|nr:protein phosphatase [Streptomyces sp. RKND-216]